MAYFSPKIEIKKIVNAALDEALPTWEANYEPGNVSDYLIGYANSEAAAKGAALAWLQSQSDIDLETVEWVEMPVGNQHDHWYDLIQNHADGIPTDTGINVRHRLPATVRDAARTASGQQPECAPCNDTGACNGGPCAHPSAEQPDPATADDPVQLRWGHGDVLWGDDDTVIVCLSGPDRRPYWLELDAERAAALRDDLTTPAVGQPAETHDTEARTRQLILNCLTGRAVCPVPRPVDEATGLLDAYRAAILTAAADRFAAFDLHTEAAALRRMAVEDER